MLFTGQDVGLVATEIYTQRVGWVRQRPRSLRARARRFRAIRNSLDIFCVCFIPRMQTILNILLRPWCKGNKSIWNALHLINIVATEIYRQRVGWVRQTPEPPRWPDQKLTRSILFMLYTKSANKIGREHHGPEDEWVNKTEKLWEEIGPRLTRSQGHVTMGVLRRDSSLQCFRPSIIGLPAPFSCRSETRKAQARIGPRSNENNTFTGHTHRESIVPKCRAPFTGHIHRPKRRAPCLNGWNEDTHGSSSILIETQIRSTTCLPRRRRRERSWNELKWNVPFLAGGVPNLGLDDLAVDLEGAGGELDADGGLGLEAELVAREAGEQVGLADAGVAVRTTLKR